MSGTQGYILIDNQRKYSLEEQMSMAREYREKISGIIYVRVSTYDQAHKGYSLASQIELCVAKAMQKGKKEEELLVIVEPGDSGDNPNRVGLNQVMFFLENGVDASVYLLHPDRLSRDLGLQTRFSSRVWEMGLDLEFVESAVDPNDAESMLMYNIQGSIAQYNKAKIVANSRRGRKRKARDGKIPGMKRIYGYSFDTENDTLAINPSEAMVIRQAVSWLLEGKDGELLSCTQIAKELALRGVPAPESTNWAGSNISRMLKNPTYTGTFYYGKTHVIRSKGKSKQYKKPKEDWIAIKVPEIIDKDTHERVLAAIDGHRKYSKGRKTTNYLLRGIVKCGRCGCAVHPGAVSQTDSMTYYYYTCSNKGNRRFVVGTGEVKNRCRGRNWRVDEVDTLIWDYVQKRIENPTVLLQEIAMQRENQGQVTSWKAEISHREKVIRDIEQKRSKYLDLYGEGLIEKDELSAKLSPLSKQKEALQEDVQRLSRLVTNSSVQASEASRLSDLLRAYQQYVSKSLSFEEKRNLIGILIEQVVLTDDKLEIVARWGNVDASIYNGIASNIITSEGHGRP